MYKKGLLRQDWLFRLGNYVYFVMTMRPKKTT